MAEKSCRRKADHAAKGCLLIGAFQSGLEALRLEAQLTRGEFAKSLGIPRSSYFHLMTTAANPSLSYIELIAERAGVDPLTLLRKRDLGTVGTRRLNRLDEGKRIFKEFTVGLTTSIY